MSNPNSPFGDFHLRTQIPYFSGEYVDWWVYHVECFFHHYHTINEQKLRIGEVYLVGEALEWYNQWHREIWWRWFRWGTWEEFVRDIKVRFQPPEQITYPSNELKSISNMLEEMMQVLDGMMMKYSVPTSTPTVPKTQTCSDCSDIYLKEFTESIDNEEERSKSEFIISVESNLRTKNIMDAASNEECVDDDSCSEDESIGYVAKEESQLEKQSSQQSWAATQSSMTATYTMESVLVDCLKGIVGEFTGIEVLVTVAMNEEEIIEFDQGWDYMQGGITKLKNILEGLPEPQFTPGDYMNLYSIIYKMCSQKPPHDYSQQLYDKYRVTFEDYIRESVLPSIGEKHDEFILKEFVRRWGNHKVMVRWLSRFFYYLERNFVPRRSLLPLHDVGFTCFRELVYEVVKEKVRDAVIKLIDQEREGEQIDRALLKNVVAMFVDIGMGSMDPYQNDFEKAMLDNSAEYYSRKASTWILEDSWLDYMFKVGECLKHEKERTSHYLYSSSQVKLLDKVQNELLTVYATHHLETELSYFRSLLSDDKKEDLSRIYQVFSQITHGLDPFSSIFKQHVTGEVTALVKQAEETASTKKAEKRDIVGPDEQLFVRKVIELHDKYLAYVSNCFQNHALFRKALKEAFEVFCNKGVGGNSSAELLTTFCDNILKKGASERLSDETIEETLERVVKLLAYISDKDLFVEFYRKKLARRLLFDKSANNDHERSILTKLKQECGGQFTSKMEGMVTDLTLAREIQTSFEDYINNNPDSNPGIDLSVTVLTRGFWPSYKSFDLNLPSEMVKCVEVFEKFYLTKTKQRKLTWIYSLGTCNLTAKFDAKIIELIVTSSQAAALLLFNAAERLSYIEIATQLNLNDENVIKVLHSLSGAKYKILNKEPATTRISPTDYFQFNSKFTDKMRRIKIPMPPVDEKKKVINDVKNDRGYAIDATIVRIMKSRKVLNQQQLFTECVEQLGDMFKTDFKAIKMRIEDLIVRDYLERDEGNPNVFRYLA